MSHTDVTALAGKQPHLSLFNGSPRLQWLEKPNVEDIQYSTSPSPSLPPVVPALKHGAELLVYGLDG
jgi:hypothetical protein